MRAAFILIALVLASNAVAQADKSGDPTPRKGIDPSDAAKVRQVQAKRWLNFGADANQVEQEVSGSIPGRRSCTTNIGPAAQGGTPGTPRSGVGQRSDSVVVVTGSVINLCR